jgi:hypothetical protein
VSSVVRVPLGALAAAALVMGAAACSDSSTGPSTGSLTVNITAPAGVTGNVTVTGPNGYSKSLTATETLTSLPAGAYTVAGAAVFVPDAVVGGDTNTATVAGSPASVGRNKTATVTVTYAAGAPVGALWVLNGGSTSMTNELVAFAATQLTASGSPAPILGMIGQQVTTTYNGGAVAFDRQGNLWSVDGQNGTLTEYTATQLDTANPTPVLTITMPGGTYSDALAFDSAGNVWIVNPSPCAFYQYAAATLANHTGAVSLAPDITIATNCNGPSSNPSSIAFDRNWNMWVGDNGNDAIYEYPADSLKSGFSGLYTARMMNLHGVGYIAFDASGDLWFDGASFRSTRDSTYELTAAQLADTISLPTPNVSIGFSTTSAHLQGIAFDNSGNLWLADASSNSAVYELSAAQLTAGGAVTPAVTLSATSSSLANPWGLAFTPHSSGLPLFAHAAPIPSRSRTTVRRH